MRRFRLHTLALAFTLLLSIFAVAPSSAAPAQGNAQARQQRFLVVAKSDADLNGLRSDVTQAGGTIVRELRQVRMLVVSAPDSFRAKIAASPRTEGVAKDHVSQLRPPEGAATPAAPKLNKTRVQTNAANKRVTADPALAIPGLLWNYDRIRAPQAWKVTTGDPAVTVGVADTGLDYTHSELASQVVDVVDLTASEDPPLCKTFFGTSDQDLAAQYGGPADTDWNGHGSWIGGNIAAALDGKGINGIAPDVRLVALKISQWCGSAYDSTLIESFLYAADNNIDVVSISFGGYLDRRDPDQNLIYQQYVAAVAYARRQGTVIAASAGNEHVRIGAGGLVLSRGSLTTPGTELNDLIGLWEVPGGIPGVVDVSSTNNVVNGPSPSCPPGTTESTNATCKPASDQHQPFGVGKQNQLAYYSNYGPRIDIAAPGGARKFNLPAFDRGGTPGFPYTTADGTNVWETFSITSNWATQIPCFTLNINGFPPDQCYTTIQGTSMATPHVSAVLALIASEFPNMRGRPELLVRQLKATAQKLSGNTTPPLSATDTSPGDLTGVPCSTGYCHLGGSPIPDAEAYGAGLVDAYGAVK